MRKTLDATVLRHEAIASNIANIETPNYKRVDVQPSFSSELAQALKTGEAKSIEGLQPSLAVDESAVASTKDGNTVQLETEMLELSKNTLSHNLETMWISGTFQDLRMATTGKVTRLGSLRGSPPCTRPGAAQLSSSDQSQSQYRKLIRTRQSLPPAKKAQPAISNQHRRCARRPSRCRCLQQVRRSYISVFKNHHQQSKQAQQATKNTAVVFFNEFEFEFLHAR